MTDQPDPPCWLCGDLKGIGLHRPATSVYGRPLWVSRSLEFPAGDPARPCPACAHADLFIHFQDLTQCYCELAARFEPGACP